MDELYTRLSALSDAQLDAVVQIAGLDPRYLTSGAPPATRASEIVGFTKQRQSVMDRVIAALHKVDPGGLATGDRGLNQWLSYCREVHGKLRVIGFEDRNDTLLSISDVFVPLRIRAIRRNRDIGMGPIPQNDELEPDAFASTGQIGIEESMQLALQKQLRGLAVIGDPGAGKTTVLKHLYCRVQDGTTDHLDGIQGLTPVFLPFAKLVAHRGKKRGLAYALEESAQGFVVGSWFGSIAKGIVVPPKLLVLLDGLDEVNNEAERVALCKWMDEEMALWPGSFFVATCRYAAWQREARLSTQFLTAEVEGLSPVMVEDYVHKWFRAVLSQQHPERSADDNRKIAEEEASGLVKALRDPKRVQQKRMQDMTTNPLLLSTLCLVYRSGNTLPDRRTELYHKAVGLLLDKWGQHPTRRIPNEAGRQVLQPVAWAMHERFDPKQDTTRTIGAQELVKLIAEPLSQTKDLPKDPQEFLNRVCQGCGLLASPDMGVYQFFHLGFQEYLAAGHARGDERRLAWLVSRLGDSKWEEPFLLAACLDGAFVPLMREVVKQKMLPAQKNLVRQSLDEVSRLDPTPFIEVLEECVRNLPTWRRWLGWVSGASRNAAQHPETIAAIFELFRFRAPTRMVELAEQLVGHWNAQVQTAAWAVVETAKGATMATEQSIRTGVPPANPQPKQRWREPTLGIDFVWVPPATFWMGSSSVKGQRFYDKDGMPNEWPPHPVTLTQGYWISVFPITNELYQRFTVEGGGVPALCTVYNRFNHNMQPVTGVTWEDAQQWCQWATRATGLLIPWHFDLPTEAQWEYAARGTDGRKYPWGNRRPTQKRAIWGRDFRIEQPEIIGTRPSGKSPFGVEDMAGNVWEWCKDKWTAHDLEQLPRIDPCNQSGKSVYRSVRGGAWEDGALKLRCAYRLGFRPEERNLATGFRVVCCVSFQHSF